MNRTIPLTASALLALAGTALVAGCDHNDSRDRRRADDSWRSDRFDRRYDQQASYGRGSDGYSPNNWAGQQGYASSGYGDTSRYGSGYDSSGMNQPYNSRWNTPGSMRGDTRNQYGQDSSTWNQPGQYDNQYNRNQYGQGSSTWNQPGQYDSQYNRNQYSQGSSTWNQPGQYDNQYNRNQYGQGSSTWNQPGQYDSQYYRDQYGQGSSSQRTAPHSSYGNSPYSTQPDWNRDAVHSGGSSYRNDWNDRSNMSGTNQNWNDQRWSDQQRQDTRDQFNQNQQQDQNRWNQNNQGQFNQNQQQDQNRWNQNNQGQWDQNRQQDQNRWNQNNQGQSAPAPTTGPSATSNQTEASRTNAGDRAATTNSAVTPPAAGTNYGGNASGVRSETSTTPGASTSTQPGASTGSSGSTGAAGTTSTTPGTATTPNTRTNATGTGTGTSGTTGTVSNAAPGSTTGTTSDASTPKPASTTGSGTSSDTGPRSSTTGSTTDREANRDANRDGGFLSSSDMDRNRTAAPAGSTSDALNAQGRTSGTDTTTRVDTNDATRTQQDQNRWNQNNPGQRNHNQQQDQNRWNQNQPNQNWSNRPEDMGNQPMNQQWAGGRPDMDMSQRPRVDYHVDRSMAAQWSGPTRSFDDRWMDQNRNQRWSGQPVYGNQDMNNSWNRDDNRMRDDRWNDNRSRDNRWNDDRMRDDRWNDNRMRDDRWNNDRDAWRNQPSRQHNRSDLNPSTTYGSADNQWRSSDRNLNDPPSLYNGRGDRTFTSAGGPASWGDHLGTTGDRTGRSDASRSTYGSVDNPETPGRLFFGPDGEPIYLNHNEPPYTAPIDRPRSSIDDQRTYGSVSSPRVDQQCDTADKQMKQRGAIDADGRTYGSARFDDRLLNRIDPYSGRPVQPGLTSSFEGVVIGFSDERYKQRFDQTPAVGKRSLVNSLRSTR